ITALVVRTIALCTHYSWPVIAGAIILAILSAWYSVTHFAMTTDINQLLSTKSPARLREVVFEQAFPQFETIVAVVDAPTPELVEGATEALVQRLAPQTNFFRSIHQPGGGPFFAQNGLLFQSKEQLEPQMKMLSEAQRLLQALASDPSLRGV